ncbi:hypothetical protein [Pedobacter sp. MC2016-24]|uniref:hypothetical protein n=1 Tax=Pedobacter sp. MC2016-24 TaxID=2780090 RepID=UPI00188242C2|nr:hypothetical protein [Pedobacter sp. MC2016-24]MBE9599805.1 hypothetical protein [Pedobacter sp. MC2016-24]
MEAKSDKNAKSSDLIRTIVNDALKQKMWVFDPASKRWFTPGEFMEMYERYDKLDITWLDNIQVLDPIEGLEAADQLIQSIMTRRTALARRIIDYWKDKK